MVLEIDGELTRVQCKTGRLREGAVRFAPVATTATIGIRRPAIATIAVRFDYFAVYRPETTGVYVVPIQDVPGSRSAYLRVDPPRNQQRRKIRFAAAYEVARVATEGLRGPSGA